MKSLLILATILLLVVVATASSFAGRAAMVQDVPTNAIPPLDVPSNLGQSDEAGPEVKLVLLALFPHGFETSEVLLEPGDHLFIIGNRTGLREVNFRIDREGKERVAPPLAISRQKDWKQRLTLTTGTYLITANDNPEWTCRIVVGS